MTSRKVQMPLRLFSWNLYLLSYSLLKKNTHTHTKFHENETNDFVINTRSLTAKLMWFQHQFFFIPTRL